LGGGKQERTIEAQLMDWADDITSLSTTWMISFAPLFAEEEALPPDILSRCHPRAAKGTAVRRDGCRTAIFPLEIRGEDYLVQMGRHP